VFTHTSRNKKGCIHMFGPLGLPELILIFAVALIVFGPRRLPEIGRTLGKALGEFKKASDELKSTIEREVRADELKQLSHSAIAPLQTVSRTEPAPPIEIEAQPAPATPVAPAEPKAE
jgi:TatA/E family protein of Tat protein translocase